MENTGKKRGHKLTSGMVRVIVTCWIIPYIVLSAVLIFAYTRRHLQQVEQTISASTLSAATITADNISAAIEMSRQASYDGVIKKSYEAYLKDGDENAMYREVSDYLNRTYKFSKTISNTILLYEQPMTMEYYSYSNVAGATYASIEEFRNNTAEAVRKAARDLDTKTRLICISGHLYVVRNIVLSNYEPFATLVMEVNMDRLFDSMKNIIWEKQTFAYLDGEVIWQTLPGEEAPPLQEMQLPREGESITVYDHSKAMAAICLKVNGQIFRFVTQMDPTLVLNDRTAFLSVYAIVFITLIPLLIATFWYFYSNINKPLGSLMKGSEKIREGEYGYRVPPFDKNEEIGQLVDTFNHMSVSLEDSFNRIYVEEIAERDATLKALQSQINPHFLNNTLEIINWKARMQGNEDVSDMISALSVMMNATLNRNNEMFIPLSEELSYVDAYLFIIRARFGEKFQFTVDADESLMGEYIPRLIIQPIVENAVEHGGDEKGRILGQLTVTREADTLLITVENNGKLTDEDRKRIEMLLTADVNAELTQADLDRMSIGIRNVNLRLQLIYGEESGLTITDDGTGVTRSVLTICTSKNRQLQTTTDKSVS